MAMNTGAELPGPSAGDGTGAGDGPADDERLACGRMLSEVWEARADSAHDPHLRACPHCSAAVRQLDLLGAAVREAGSGPERDWDAGALTERVMDVVRLELRPGRPLPLGEREEDLWVREAMAAKALRAAAETVPGVRAGSCRIRPAESGGFPARGPVRVRLEVVVPLTPGLHDLAEEVRRRVRRAADDALGLPVDQVDVHITDVTDPAGAGPGPDDAEEGTRP